MSIGAERKSYPFILSDMKVWSSNSRIVNCSMPGFTSTDACAFFFNNLKSFEDIQSVIIYLGNCDTMSSELNKGKYTIFNQLKYNIKNTISTQNKKLKLKNRLLHYEWNKFYDSSIETPVSESDFIFNISRVIKYCEKKNITVLLVRPIAHKHFPSGTGKGNIIFYHYFDLTDKVADLISIDDKRFQNAMALYEKGDYIKAAKEYKDILFHTSELSGNLEYQTLVVNNYAVCKAKAGEYDEANHLLTLMLNERGSRKDIVLYNLALIAKEQGEYDLYNKLLNDSYEADDSMYRIREPYKKSIDKIANKYVNVKTINQMEFFNDDDFIDHCHILPEAQERFADIVFEKIYTEKLKGNSQIDIVNILYNPEYGLGNNQVFNDYFKSFSSMSSSDIKSHIGKISGSIKKVMDNEERTNSLESLPADIKYAFEYYQRHPCFSRLYDIVMAKPSYSSDVGRFPEFFLIRFMIPFVKKIESTPHFKEHFSSRLSLLRTSDELLSILPDESKKWVENEIPEVESDYALEWIEVIINSIHNQLLSHLQKGNQIGNRLKGTIFWYFREALRFGSHSRISMRYERITLEYITEALAVALVLDDGLAASKKSDICNLINIVENIVNTHEKYCSSYNPELNNKQILQEYDKALINIMSSINKQQPT
ncbi:MAG: hypothetical protein QM504_09390 [Pseudomonadota bacterium]